MVRPSKRTQIPADVRRAVLIEAGYQCAVPTCRTILALDVHHLVRIADGGPNTIENLIALCPTCHALHHRGVIPLEAIRVWKVTLEALSHAFDQRTINLLLALDSVVRPDMPFSTDSILEMAPLINVGLVHWGGHYGSHGGSAIRYHLTEKGHRFVGAWKSGDRAALAESLITRDSI
jgi:HNH endonuclease